MTPSSITPATANPPGWSDSVLSNSTLRPSVMQLTIKDRAALFAAYIPSFKDGGIFSMSSREYTLGDELYVLLSLPDDPQRHAIAGIVAWITPANAQSGRAQGVGIKFPSDQSAVAVKRKIEALLGPLLLSDKAKQTI